MIIKIKNKKIKVLEYTTFKDRVKSLKFVLEPIDYGIKIPNTRWMSTYYFCQRVDICITDNENKIVYLRAKCKSEKRKFLWKKHNVYYFPLNTCQDLNIGDVLEIKK